MSTIEIDRLKAQIAALQRKIDTPMPEQERNELSAAQVRADAVAAKFGEASASKPIPGETAIQFRKRLAGEYKKHSPRYRNANIEMIGDQALLTAAEEVIYADAAAAAVDPSNYRPFEMRAVKERDAAGREVTRWVGDSWAWRRFFSDGAKIGFINDPRRG